VLYAGVIVDVRAEAVDRIFQYSIPDKLAGKLELGHRVLVPFGHRRVEGYVVEFSGELEISADRLKSIIRLLDEEPIILPAQMELARWLRNHYVGLLSEALQFMLPPGNRYGKERVGFKQQQMVTLVNPDVELRANATAQRRMLEILLDKGRILASELVKKARASYSSLESLAKLGAVQIEDKVLERKVAWEPVSDPTLVLTEEQTAALREINKERKGSRRPVLLHGVTGSGKTEIYLQAIAEVIKEGRQAIVLVPEIALTPQMLSRFGARFGDRISVLHSALSLGERFDQWWKIYNGDVSVVIGARSAVFAPTPNLGLIVVDEEHEGTYKQEQGSIRYVTRDVAEKRCELTGAQLILGSATPSLDL
jgi:primosomal protein N' (replication factor Y)